MPKKPKEKIDGLSPRDIVRYTGALRRVWAWSHAWRLTKKRCELPGGYARCEQCHKKCPKVYVDHKVPCGNILEPGYVARLGVASSGLQGLCKSCHQKKTNEESAFKRACKKYGW